MGIKGIKMSAVKTKKTGNRSSRYTFLLFFTIIALFSLIILKPFLAPLAGGLIIGYIFYPLYNKINKALKKENASALLTTILVLFMISIPFFIFANALTGEASAFYIHSKQMLATGTIINTDYGCGGGFVCSLNQKFASVMQNENTKSYIDGVLIKISTMIFNYSSSLILSIPKIMLNVLIMLFVVFFTFKDGKKAVGFFFSIVPLKDHFKKDLLKQTQDVIFATVYGNIIVAVIEGVLATIAFIAVGIASPILLGIIVIIVSIIPMIGASIIWLPASLYYILTGISNSNSIMLWKGLGLCLYGFFVISSLSTFLRPKIIGHKSNLHPVLILFGVLGGIATFGVVGMVLGPLILSILFSFIKVYERDKNEIIS